MGMGGGTGGEPRRKQKLERTEVLNRLGFVLTQLGREEPLTEDVLIVSRRAMAKMVRIGEIRHLRPLFEFEDIPERLAKQAVSVLEEFEEVPSLADVCKRAPVPIAKEAVLSLERLKKVDWLQHVCNSASEPVAKAVVLSLERLKAHDVLRNIVQSHDMEPVAESAKDALSRCSDARAEEVIAKIKEYMAALK